jgi:hypothetical protein
MAISMIRIIRPRPGQREGLLSRFSRSKRMHERCGATVRLVAAQTGPNVGAFIHVIETPRLEGLR